jgi:hypothetical protein
MQSNAEGLSYLVYSEIAFAVISFIFGLHNITSERNGNIGGEAYLDRNQSPLF